MSTSPAQKLYKTIRGRVHYWEAWKRNTKLWVHTGLLGHWGRVDKEPMNPRETEKAAIKRYAQVPLAAGYAPIDPSEYLLLVVQYPLDAFSHVDGMVFREEVYALLNNCLGWIGNGACDRGEFGRNTLNMVCDVVDPELAVKPIVADLRKAKKLAGAVIATRRGRSLKVLWPKGYRKPFTLA